MKTAAAVERMRRRATAAVRAGFYATPAARSVAGRVRPRALVLTYHRIGEPVEDPFGQAVTGITFANHLRVLRSNYRVQSVDGLVRELRERRLEEGTVVVTFDDGYADVMLEAAPIAAEQEVPLHLFVAVQPILEGTRFWWDRLAAALLADRSDGHSRISDYRVLHARLKELPAEERTRQLDEILGRMPERHNLDLGRPLTPEELRLFSSSPEIGIGAHTVSHPALGALALDEQQRELTASRSSLTELIGKDVHTVAYPFGKAGDLSPETPRLAAEAGYAAGFTTIARALTARADRFLLPRLTAHEWPEDLFRARLRAIFGY